MVMRTPPQSGILKRSGQGQPRLVRDLELPTSGQETVASGLLGAGTHVAPGS